MQKELEDLPIWKVDCESCNIFFDKPFQNMEPGRDRQDAIKRHEKWHSTTVRGRTISKGITKNEWKLIIDLVDGAENESQGEYSPLETKLCKIFPDIVNELQKEKTAELKKEFQTISSS